MSTTKFIIFAATPAGGRKWGSNERPIVSDYGHSVTFKSNFGHLVVLANTTVIIEEITEDSPDWFN